MDGPKRGHDESSATPAGGGPSLDRMLESLASGLQDEADVAFAYVFGSTVKGRTRKESDLDVAVFLITESGGDGPRLARRGLELESGLERRMGRPVQVVVLNKAPSDLVQNVLGHGRLAFCRDDALRRRHYVEHARRYYDMAHARDIFDRSRSRRIEEGTFGGGARDGS